MLKRAAWLGLFVTTLILLLAPSVASAQDRSGADRSWLMAFLWAIGFDGEHTGRGLLILLGLLLAAVFITAWAVRRVRREVRGYAQAGRSAFFQVRSRFGHVSHSLATTFSPEASSDTQRERQLAERLRHVDPSFDLDAFKRDRGQDFVQARQGRHSVGDVALREVRLIDAHQEADHLVATLRFHGTASSQRPDPSFEEEWIFTRPLRSGSAWNAAEERVIQPRDSHAAA